MRSYGLALAAVLALSAGVAQCEDKTDEPPVISSVDADGDGVSDEEIGAVDLSDVELVSFQRPRWGCYITGGTLVRTPSGYVCSWGAGGSFR